MTTILVKAMTIIYTRSIWGFFEDYFFFKLLSLSNKMMITVNTFQILFWYGFIIGYDFNY